MTRDTTNNKWSNLREATPQQSSANRRRPRHNKSGHKGVERAGGMWVARIGFGYRLYSLGRFEAAELAGAMYRAVGRAIFGDFFHDGVEPTSRLAAPGRRVPLHPFLAGSKYLEPDAFIALFAAQRSRVSRSQL